jgi:hypothetical protein
MTGRTFTVGEIATGCFGDNERLTRLMLWTCCDRMRTGISDPAEVIPVEALLRLVRMHRPSNRIRRAVAAFLARQREEATE